MIRWRWASRRPRRRVCADAVAAAPNAAIPGWNRKRRRRSTNFRQPHRAVEVVDREGVAACVALLKRRRVSGAFIFPLFLPTSSTYSLHDSRGCERNIFHQPAPSWSMIFRCRPTPAYCCLPMESSPFCDTQSPVGRFVEPRPVAARRRTRTARSWTVTADATQVLTSAKTWFASDTSEFELALPIQTWSPAKRQRVWLQAGLPLTIRFGDSFFFTLSDLCAVHPLRFLPLPSPPPWLDKHSSNIRKRMKGKRANDLKYPETKPNDDAVGHEQVSRCSLGSRWQPRPVMATRHPTRSLSPVTMCPEISRSQCRPGVIYDRRRRHRRRCTGNSTPHCVRGHTSAVVYPVALFFSRVIYDRFAAFEFVLAGRDATVGSHAEL